MFTNQSETQLLETARQFGREDAQNGGLCIPEVYFARRDLLVAYAEAYESVRGRTPLSGQILR